jgi:hypothetical protein
MEAATLSLELEKERLQGYSCQLLINQMEACLVVR